MTMPRQNNDWIYALGWIVAVAFATVALVLTSGCKTSGGIDGGQFTGEVHHAINKAYDELKAVGAPVRKPKSLKVTTKPGTVKTRDGWGFRYGDAVVAGINWPGQYIIATTPDGQWQPKIAKYELGHAVLGGTEQSDYEWFKKAGWMR